MARPSKFNDKLAAAICEQLAEGKSLRTICEAPGMPNRATVFRWLADEKYQVFRDQYARAREAQADLLAEEILEIADDGRNDTYVDEEGKQRTDHEAVARSRLRVDARKWLASKMAPKKYGDKVDVGVGNTDGQPFEISDGSAAAKIAAIMAAAEARKRAADAAQGKDS